MSPTVKHSMKRSAPIGNPIPARETRRLKRLADNLVQKLEQGIADTAAGEPAAKSALRQSVIEALWTRQHDQPPTGRIQIADSVDRIVVFLGAGASYPLGFPLTADILPAIWEGLHDGTWKKWAGFKRNQNSKVVHLVDRARDLRLFLRTVVPGLPGLGGNSAGASIVDIISLLEHSIIERHSLIHPAMLSTGKAKRPGDTSPFTQIIPRASDLFRMRELLTMGLNGVLQGQKKPKLRKDLAKWIVRRARPQAGRSRRISLVSTNYDTAIETALFQKLEEKGPLEKSVDFGFTWRDPTGNLCPRVPAAPYAVFKLHGSLNWLRCQTCGHVTINPKQRIASLHFWEGKNVYNSCECDGLLKSVLVTPSVVRDIRDANLLSVWDAALEDLRQAQLWIIVGFSLPSEDVAIRSLLLRAFHARTRKDLKVRVVSYDPPGLRPPSSSYDTYHAFFPEANFEREDYDPRGVEPFVADLS